MSVKINKNVSSHSSWMLLHLSGYFILSILIAIVISVYFPKVRLINDSLHTLYESAGSLSAIILSSFIIIMWRNQQVHSSYIWFASSLMAIGIFDLFHASVRTENIVLWFHSMSILSGGIIFSVIVLNKYIYRYKFVNFIPCIVGGLSFSFSIFSIVFSEHITSMLEDGHLSLAARLMNIFGGVGFFLAWLYFFRLESDELSFKEEFLLANHCIIFGLLGIMFPLSREWDAAWWLWHTFRMFAYLLILVFFLRRYSRDTKKIRANQLELEKRTLELEQTRRRLSDIIEYSPYVITLKDVDGNFIIVNNEFTRIFGYRQDEVAGRSSFDIFCKKAAELSRKEEQEVLRLLCATRNEEDYRIVDNTVKTFIVDRFPLMAKDDEIYGICCTMTDITERKAAELERKKLLLENEKRILELNFLYSISQLSEHSELELRDILRGMVELISDSWHNEAGVRIVYNEYDVQTDNFKETKWVQEAPVLIDGEAKGHIQLYYPKQFSEIDDGPFLKEERHLLNELSVRLGSIIKQKAAERELRKAFEFNDRIIEEFPVGLAIFRQDGKCIAVNSSMEALTGLEREHLLCKDYNEIAYWKNNGLCEVAEGSIAARKNKRHQFDILTREGEHIFFECLFVPFTLHDELRLLLMVDNISEHKNAEEQLKSALAEKESLLKEVHHRVKNNMQIAASLLFLQSQNIENQEAADALQDSQDRIKSMGLVHELLYRSANLSKVSFREYIDALVQSLKVSYNIYNKISFSVESDGIELSVDSAIPCGLIVNELIANSCKHAFKENSSGKVTISFVRKNAHYILSVQDNGIGLPEGYDWQASNTLGLSLVRTLSAQLNGEVRFINENGLKCVVSFTS